MININIIAGPIVAPPYVEETGIFALFLGVLLATFSSLFVFIIAKKKESKRKNKKSGEISAGFAALICFLLVFLTIFVGVQVK